MCGTGLVNCDTETGTPYGVVSMNALEDWVFDEFFNAGENLTARSAFEESGIDPDDDGAVQEFWDYYECDEEEYALDLPDEGLHLGLSYLGGAPLVWVYKSPHVAFCRPCSPCVPGAGDLDSKVEPGMRCYDLPADWYRKENSEE